MSTPQSNDDVSRIRAFVNEQHNKLPNEILCDVWDVAAEAERMRALWAGWQPIETAPSETPAPQCKGRYPTPGPRDEPAEANITYRCALPAGHEGPCGAEKTGSES